jgi:hypothetical protein
MNAVDITLENDIPLEDSYWGRLLRYRFDALDHHDNVTVILTGTDLRGYNGVRLPFVELG